MVFAMTLTSELPRLRELAEALGQWCANTGVPDDAAFKLDLVIDELVSNIIKYGYKMRPDGRIEVRVRRAGNDLVLSLRDAGEPFERTAAPPPQIDTPIEERTVGGLGLHFVRTLASQWETQRIGRINETEVRFAGALLPPPDPKGGADARRR